MTDKRFEELKKLHKENQPPWTGVPLAEWEGFTARGGLGVSASKWFGRYRPVGGADLADWGEGAF